MTSGERLLTRDEKVKNLIVNYSMIMMGIFGGVFETLATKMSEAMVAGTTAMAQALAGTTGAPTAEESENKISEEELRKKVGSQVSEGVKQMFSKMRSEVADKLSANEDSLNESIADPSFDEGIRIVEGYDFELPKLTEALSDNDLASYLTLLSKEDPELGKMFRELSEWQKTTPKLSG
jgi:hypothetical protein